MCDTLLQMGRWFGYRDGYRIYHLDDIKCYWFLPVYCWRIDNIGEQVKQMERLKKSPLEFGLMVR